MAEDSTSEIVFSQFVLVEIFRRQLARDLSAEECVEAVLASSNDGADIIKLHMDRAPTNAMEHGFFDALVQYEKTVVVVFRETMDPRSIPDLLDRVNNQNITIILVQAPEVTEQEANDVFRVLSLKGSDHLYQFFTESNDSFMSSVLQYLRDPSTVLSTLTLGCASGYSLPADTFRSLCSTHFASDSPQLLICDDSLQVQGGDGVHQIIENTILGSSFHVGCFCFGFAGNMETSTLTLDSVSRFLRSRPSVQNSDFCFSENEQRLVFFHDPWWKQLMQVDENDPLNRLWPWILEKANKKTGLASHSNKDIVFFLLKEKNDVLVPNGRHGPV